MIAHEAPVDCFSVHRHPFPEELLLPPPGPWPLFFLVVGLCLSRVVVSVARRGLGRGVVSVVRFVSVITY